ncbi:hypothetical protein [Sandaracinus amylolyticus]|uniref:DUF4239 domain-containing protein n=1 Tax=Sandaracinus amylolyticus TaxID=927083 RepID=A0A0F6SEG2_9BACT|nr:hypothetical protein [Sandaracinus amylolyticus]AKF05139.1 hypothetical protein DB32_002288 [Sandaracinus amylolyticus]
MLPDILLVEVAAIVALLIAAEASFAWGRRRADRVDEKGRSALGTMQTATLALLGLLLAFATSMAEARFSGRRALILAESNAIGTAYLRSKWLPEPHASELARLLREYVRARIELYEAGSDLSLDERANDRAASLHQQMWDHTVDVMRADPRSVATGRFVESLNEVIDLEAARWIAARAHVPVSIPIMVLAVALVAIAVTGFLCGVERKRSAVALTVVPLLIGMTFAMMLDLDSPRVGLVRAGQGPMLRLERMLAADAAR